MIFGLTEEDKQKLKEFVDNHDCTIKRDIFGRKMIGAIGGELAYTFIPTGLGTITKVKCSCGKEIDLTEYEGW